MKTKIFSLIFIVIILLSLSSCNSFKITDEMQLSVDKYISAVSSFSEKLSANLNVTTVIEDDAIEFKTTKSIIEYEYTVNKEKVSFLRKDYLNGTENASFKSDGDKVMSFDYELQDWVDKTEENTAFLSVKNNPFVTLSLFRIENNYKVKANYLSNIAERTDGEYNVIEFTLKDSTVSTVLGYNKADGIVRNSAGHTRSYYIDSKGELKKIIIVAMQNVVNNGKEGTYKSTITVEIS